MAAELARRRKLPNALVELESQLFAPQARLVTTDSLRIACRAGRRAGKTFGVGVRLIRAAANNPGRTIPVFERTLTCQAAQVLWRQVLDINEKYGLGGKPNHTLRILTFPNRAEIVQLGADTIEAADKARGGGYPEAWIDEAGTFRPKILEYLLEEVLEPALADFGGPLGVVGTPGPVCDGPFFDACHNGKWEVLHWTFLDNPKLPLNHGGTEAERAKARKAWLDELRDRHGWAENNPKYLREWLGEWASAHETLMYRFDARRNVCEALDGEVPEHRWHYVLGIDLGYNDPTAFVVWAFSKYSPKLYILESYERTGLIPSAVAAHVLRLMDRYQFTAIVADTGGYGKGPAEEMAQRYGIPVEAARKRNKTTLVEFLSGDMANGKVQVVRSGNEALISDFATLPWNDNMTDAHPAYADHLPDAALYGYGKVADLASGFGMQALEFDEERRMLAIHEQEFAESLAGPQSDWAELVGD